MASLDEAITRRSPEGDDQHEAGRGDVEHVDATVGEQGQQLDDVELVDERVGELNQRPSQHRFSGHRNLPFGRPMVREVMRGGAVEPRCLRRPP